MLDIKNIVGSASQRLAIPKQMSSTSGIKMGSNLLDQKGVETDGVSMRIQRMKLDNQASSAQTGVETQYVPESLITKIDFSADFNMQDSKAKILSQAPKAVLAQANVSAGAVMRLLS